MRAKLEGGLAGCQLAVGLPGDARFPQNPARIRIPGAARYGQGAATSEYKPGRPRPRGSFCVCVYAGVESPKFIGILRVSWLQLRFEHERRIRQLGRRRGPYGH